MVALMYTFLFCTHVLTFSYSQGNDSLITTLPTLMVPGIFASAGKADLSIANKHNWQTNIDVNKPIEYQMQFMLARHQVASLPSDVSLELQLPQQQCNGPLNITASQDSRATGSHSSLISKHQRSSGGSMATNGTYVHLCLCLIL